MKTSITNQPELLILDKSTLMIQVLQIYAQLKSISFCWMAMEELERQVNEIDKDLLYFQQGRQLFFCSKSLNKLIAKMDFHF